MQAEIAVIRFGLGARPGDLAQIGQDAKGWLKAQIKGPVALASATPLTASDEVYAAMLKARELRREAKAENAKPIDTVREAYQPHYRAQVLARAQSASATDKPFAERLVHFWSNHFAVSADKGVVYGMAGTLENEAIRGHVNGRFVELLTAVEQHPAMIAFLDNQNSAGKNSEAGEFAAHPPLRRRMAMGSNPPRQLGINENLAREILELHTLGVNGGYSQADVTTFAQIITGWSIGGGRGRFAGGQAGRFCFLEALHQPGAKRFLGKTYYESGLRQGEAVLSDIARHPSTAHFIALKLARHFIADDPPPQAVERIAKVFQKSGGDLPQVYEALIDSPEAWEVKQSKFKTPEDFVFSSMRALNASPDKPEEVVRSFELLGQRQFTPGSPAGWPDTSKSWDGSDALMHRVLFATRLAARFEKGVNPAELAEATLGDYARPETLLAVQRAENPKQGLALLLMSPEFQRR